MGADRHQGRIRVAAFHRRRVLGRDAWVPALEQLSGYAWIVGAILDGVIYFLRWRASHVV